MQAQRNNQRTYYRCRYPREFALASHAQHPVNVYLREEQVLPAVDRWLARIFAPHRLASTIRELAACRPPAAPQPPNQDCAAVIAACDAKLARYQAALGTGADPVTVAAWTRAVTADRTAALARAAVRTTTSGPPLTEAAIEHIIQALGDIRKVIRHADPATKASIYSKLDLRLTYQPGKDLIRA